MCRLPEKGRREIEEIVEEMKERDRGERKMNESDGTEEIKTFPLYPYLLQGQRVISNFKPISVGRPGDVRYMTPLPHPTTPHSDSNYPCLEQTYTPKFVRVIEIRLQCSHMSGSV